MYTQKLTPKIIKSVIETGSYRTYLVLLGCTMAVDQLYTCTLVETATTVTAARVFVCI